MDIEERCVRLIFDSNPETVRYWVKNNMSMIQNLEPGDKLMFELLLPVLRTLNINTGKILLFLEKHKPDIYKVVTRQWVQQQIDELNGKI